MATASPDSSLNDYGIPVDSLLRPVAVTVDIATPLALFLATIFTTCMMGARFAANFSMGLPPIVRENDLFPLSWILNHPSRLVEGIPFAFTILTILLAHELGHYYACRRHDVDASLPYFLPAPTLSGTAGAVIRLRSRVPNRTAMLDIGISGPFWGFMVCLPLSFLGLLLSVPSEGGNAFISSSPPAFGMLNMLVQTMRQGWPTVDHLLFHPVLLAAWIGMFVTFLNLLPAGQLDGGHILYAAFPGMHRRVTNFTILVLILGSALLWLGWMFWAVLLMLPFMRHPKIPIEPGLEKGTGWLPFAALVLLLLTMMPMPFTNSSLQHFLH